MLYIYMFITNFIWKKEVKDILFCKLIITFKNGECLTIYARYLDDVSVLREILHWFTDHTFTIKEFTIKQTTYAFDASDISFIILKTT